MAAPWTTTPCTPTKPLVGQRRRETRLRRVAWVTLHQGLAREASAQARDCERVGNPRASCGSRVRAR